MSHSWGYHCKDHCTLSPKFSHAFFSYSSSFPIKINATDAKTQKIEPDPIFLWHRKFRRQCVNVIVTTWSRIYFSTCEKFWTKILDSVCRDLNSVSFVVCLWGKPHYVWHNLPITPIDLKGIHHPNMKLVNIKICSSNYAKVMDLICREWTYLWLWMRLPDKWIN